MAESKNTAWTALVGAASGAAVAALITSSTTRNVERDKFNYQLIQDALSDNDPKTREDRLKFLLEENLITDRSLLASLGRRLEEAKKKGGSELPHVPPVAAQPPPEKNEKYVKPDPGSGRR